MSTIKCYDQFGKAYQFEESQFINREAVYGLYLNHGKILLVKDSKAGTWEIPGGGKEAYETDEECLTREFFEETGLTIDGDIHKYSQNQTFFYDKESEHPWKTLRKFYFVTKAKGILKSEGNTTDITEACFFKKNELKTINIQNNTITMLSNLHKQSSSNIRNRESWRKILMQF